MNGSLGWYQASLKKNST